MPLRMVVGVGPIIAVLNFGGNRRKESGSYRRENFGTFHCNHVQWDCLHEGR